MTLRNMVKVLFNHDNCYVNEIPSDFTMRRLKTIFNCDITVRYVTSVGGGYILEKVKEVKKNVG